jgi:hypothetical protein
VAKDLLTWQARPKKRMSCSSKGWLCNLLFIMHLPAPPLEGIPAVMPINR